MKVDVIVEHNEGRLSRKVNEKLNELEKEGAQIIDIKFTSSDRWLYVMIIYK